MRRGQGWLQWYEDELENPFLLSKARAVVNDGECIKRAAEQAGARTGAEEAAPTYLLHAAVMCVPFAPVTRGGRQLAGSG